MVSCYVFKRKNATVSKNMQKCVLLRKRLNVLLSLRVHVSMPASFVARLLPLRFETYLSFDLAGMDGRYTFN